MRSIGCGLATAKGLFSLISKGGGGLVGFIIWNENKALSFLKKYNKCIN
jgi:hypothetical protein